MATRLFRFTAVGLVLSALFLGAGCTSVKLQSTKDPAAVRKINRLFVLINQGETDNPKLSNELIDHFRNCLRACLRIDERHGIKRVGEA